MSASSGLFCLEHAEELVLPSVLLAVENGYLLLPRNPGPFPLGTERRKKDPFRSAACLHGT